MHTTWPHPCIMIQYLVTPILPSLNIQEMTVKTKLGLLPNTNDISQDFCSINTANARESCEDVQYTAN